MAFKYDRSRTTEDVERRSKISGGGYDRYFNPDIPMFKAKEGENKIRILPPTWLEDEKAVEKWGKDWSILIHFHRNVGPDNGTYLCLDKMLGKRCPVCEIRRELDEDEKEALKLQTRPVCYLVDRGSERTGPQWMPMPMRDLFKEIQVRSIDKENDSVIYIDDPEDGFDVTFHREGSDMKTRYSGVELARKPSFLCKDEDKQDDWLKFIQDNQLFDQLIFQEADHLEKILFGQSERRKGREAVDEKEDTRGERRSRREEPEGGEKEDRRSSRRERDNNEEAEAASERRGRSRDEGEREERSERRSSRDEGEKGERSERRRGREEPTDEGGEREERPTSRRRGEPEEPEGRTERRRLSSKDDETSESPSEQARERVGRLRDRAR